MLMPQTRETGMHCVKCKEPIYAGDKYIDFDGKIYCEHCVFFMGADEVFNMFGYFYMIAEI